MKKLMTLAFLFALVLAFAGRAHAATAPEPAPTPQIPSTESPDSRGPIDPFPPPTWF